MSQSVDDIHQKIMLDICEGDAQSCDIENAVNAAYDYISESVRNTLTNLLEESDE